MSDIHIEVVPPGGAYGQDLTGPPLPESFSARANEIADSVAEVAQQFRARIDQAISKDADATNGWQLGQVEVAFGLQAEAGTGVLIARASVGATFTATLTWTR
jgi:hypothetical protein